MTITNLIAEICKSDEDVPLFINDRTALRPILDKLNDKLPQDLVDYLDNCLPEESYGRMVEFHGLETMIVENQDAVPGVDAIEQGFLCIAQEGDGSQFAYFVPTGEIYHLGFEIGVNPTATQEGAWNKWANLAEFLRWYLKELCEFHAQSDA